MIKQNTDIKDNSIKFPQIRSRNLDSPSLSSTSRQLAKLRPASLNKVQDLEKKLFNKLNVYQQIAVKKKGKRIASIKDASLENLIQNPFDLQKFQPSSQITDKQFDPNLQKLKKLMPQLYSKLMEAKDGSCSGTSIPQYSQFTTIAINSSKDIGKERLGVSTNKQKQQSSNTIKSKTKSIGIVQTQTQTTYANLKINHHPFLTQLRNSSSNHVSNGSATQKVWKIERQNKPINKQLVFQTDFDKIQRITNKQMQQIYKEYQIQEGLDKKTQNFHYHSNDELKNMGKDLIDCQSEIKSLEISMSSLIKQIGKIYASDMIKIGIQYGDMD